MASDPRLDLEEGLKKDFAEAQVAAEKGRAGKGITGKQDPSRAVKGVRVGKRAIAKAEFDRLDRAIKAAKIELTRDAQAAGQIDMAQFRLDLEQEFNNLKLETLRGGFELEKTIRDANVRQARRIAIAGAYTGVATGLGFVATSGVFKRKENTGADTDLQTQQALRGDTNSQFDFNEDFSGKFSTPQQGSPETSFTDQNKLSTSFGTGNQSQELKKPSGKLSQDDLSQLRTR